MKKLIPILFAAFIVVMVIYRIATHAQTERVKSIGEIQKENGIPVEVESAAFAELTKILNFTGTVQGITQATANAKISERIVELNVKVGDRVEQNQILALLNQSSPQIAFTQAQLALEDAERELQRMKSLFQQGAVSLQTLNKVELGFQIAQADFKQVKELTQITAPVSGTVTHIFFQPGETPPLGDPVVKIAKMDRIRVEMQAAQLYWNELKTGQKAYVYLTAAPEKRIEGKVERVSLSADPDSRSFSVYVTAPNPGGYFQPGVSVETEIVAAAKTKSVAVPRDALIKERGKTYVFLAGEKAQKVQVETGLESDSMIEILSGIQPGAKVIVNGQNLLSDGDPLKIINR